jgi:N-acetylglucosaminyl-diphospho-decaprenol L-rhamnosyltransferase
MSGDDARFPAEEQVGNDDARFPAKEQVGSDERVGHRWTVVTVTYNSADTLARCWNEVPDDADYEWVVVDNNSTDNSVQVAKELGARVISLPQNVGFSRANNIALKETDSPYVLFANPDLIISSDGLAQLAAHLDRHGGLVAPQLLSADGTPQPNGRGFPYMTAKLGNRSVWPFSRLHSSYRIYTEPGETRWVSWFIGAALAVRRTDFESIGGWNERFFLYYEDAEVCLRAWRHGLPSAVLGDVRWVHHWGRATNSLRWSNAHTMEIRAAKIFYGMFPEFVFGLPLARWRHGLAAQRSGKIAHGA